MTNRSLGDLKSQWMILLKRKHDKEIKELEERYDRKQLIKVSNNNEFNTRLCTNGTVESRSGLQK